MTKLFRIILLWIVALGTCIAQATDEYYVSVRTTSPSLNGYQTQQSGTGYLASRKQGLVVTAYHNIPGNYPALRPGALTVNGKRAKLKCFWDVADLAVLQLEEELPNNVQELELHPNPVIGMSYQSGMTSNILMEFPPEHSAENALIVISGSLVSKGTVLQVSEGKFFLQGGVLKPTGAWFLITDSPAKVGFSGGPALFDKKVIGIQKGGATMGLYGLLVSSRTIAEFLERPECR
jgi:hypothetical protein